jgi:hypothetical protein
VEKGERKMDMRFKELRERIEGLIKETKGWIEKKSILESSKRIEEAQNLLTNLRDIIGSDVQKRAVFRLTIELEILAKQIDEILSKREAGKKEDGNIAFKCNWNDMHYKAPCGQDAFEFNIREGRAWCSSSECKCRQYINVEVTLKNHPCYESIALKEMYFGAGWDHTGERNQPRHIHSVRQGRMAILTTRPPGVEEEDRLIIGCLYIAKAHDDPDTETKIYGDKDKSFEIDYDKIKVKFWDYYKNAGAPDLILWASGLFRYIGDETVLNILNAVGEKYKNSGKDTKKIIDLIKYYEELIQNKKKIVNRP